ncbi:HNH endonuclease signature motif containing protein [Sinomonas sp. P10A9]|uniref:DUF222 domain-containing protein n=1 Tax=Sinomonas puerhi TaxID=3238584 RepID=A0AB39L3T5_9MICC
MTAPASTLERSPAEPFSFVSRDRDSVHGALWIDPSTLGTPEGTARALKALADFDAYSAAMKALLVNLIGQQIAEEPLEGRGGQPTRLGGELAHAATVSEVALLQNTSEAVAARNVNFSDRLVDTHPAVHEALFAGDITESHAKIIVEQAATLPDEAAEAFGVEALSRLHTRKGHRRTPGELRGVIRALRERLHPESIAKRRVRAQADRRVWFQPEEDGMCTLTALLPSEVGFAAYKRLDAIAQAAHGAEGEYRTKPQLRADALAQALLETQARIETASNRQTASNPAADPTTAEAVSGGSEGGLREGGGCPAPVRIPEGLDDLVKAEIVVHIPVATLLGASDDVAELEGFGVIDAQTARELAAAAPTWQRLLTDEDDVPVRLGRTAYRPPEGLRRFVRYRDGVCVVPGCTCAARRTEIDHTIEWQDGGTSDADNLALLCPKHHALKSLALFTLRRTADQANSRRTDQANSAAPMSGELVWKTLLGFEHAAGPLERDHILSPRTVELPSPPEASSLPESSSLPEASRTTEAKSSVASARAGATPAITPPEAALTPDEDLPEPLPPPVLPPVLPPPF